MLYSHNQSVARLPLPVATALRRGRRLCRVATSSLRPLPDFIIIGAQKGGTTSLYHYLTQHPRVRRAVGKGVHFFDEHYERGEAWYRSNFPVFLPREHREEGNPLRPLTGEASPDYMPHPLVPARMAALVPDVKLIAVLRDPVDRAWSHYHHDRRKGREQRGFAEAVQQEWARLEGDPDRPDLPGVATSYLSRGLYAEQLERWLASFARTQLLVIKSEDLYGQPEGTTREVFAFLGLPSWKDACYQALNSGAHEARQPEDLECAERLRRWFAPHNGRLERLLGQDLGWGA